MFNRFLLILSLSLFSLFAQASEVYVVKAIKIAANDKNASIARNIAVEKGQLKAFQILVKRHYPSALSKISSIDTNMILGTVAGFELSEERRSTTNYFAKLNVKFSRDHLDKLMHGLGADFHQVENIAKAEELEQEQPVANQLPTTVTSPTLNSLLVPVYEKAGKTYWLEDENIWLHFWHKKLATNFAEVKSRDLFTLAAGDLEDLSLLNKHILSKNIIDLSALFEKYDVNNIVLLRLGNLENSPTPHLTMQVNYINKYNPRWQQHNFPDLEGDNLEELLKQASSELYNFNFNSANLSKASTNFSMTNPHTIAIDFPIEKLSDWVELEQILKTNKYITHIDLKTMNTERYNFALTYKISFIDLQTLLQSYNFNLLDRGDNKFLLMRDVPNAEY